MVNMSIYILYCYEKCYVYVHKFQMTYSSKYNAEVGMLDRENSERLWAYIRKFVPITKEQTGDHRQHLLSEAIN